MSLADAEKRLQGQGLGAWLRKAYTEHCEELRAAMDRAATRHSTHFEQREAELIRDDDWSAEWRGTADQLRAVGIGGDVAFPAELSPRWSARTRDAKGCLVVIKQSDIWPWLFLADVELTADVRRARELLRKTAVEAEVAQVRRLRELPATPDAFRREVAATFWSAVHEALDALAEGDGYRLTDDDRERFRDCATDAYWAIRHGSVEGRSPREKVRKVVAAHAQGDERLQRLLKAARLGAERDLALGRAAD